MFEELKRILFGKPARKSRRKSYKYRYVIYHLRRAWETESYADIYYDLIELTPKMHVPVPIFLQWIKEFGYTLGDVKISVRRRYRDDSFFEDGFFKENKHALLEESISTYQQMLDLESLTEEERKEYQRKLRKAEKELEKVLKREIRRTARKRKMVKERLEKGKPFKYVIAKYDPLMRPRDIYVYDQFKKYVRELP